jgi:phosphoribosyl 1,2-cyclic phosphodiesterase
MELKILGSSSSGNCYLLCAEREVLIIEAGVRITDIKKALGFNISQVAACLVSHQHNDHSKSMREMLEAGITVMALKEVFEAKELSGAFARVIHPERGYCAGGFKIVPLEVKHDVPCLGFHIFHPESGSILFITDTFMVEHSFENINHILIECNYADDILIRNIASGRISKSMKPRLMQTHMEFETCKGVIRSLDISKLRNIVLIHLSSGNSHEERFITEITGEFGVKTIAGNKEVNINFDLIPY